MGAPGTSNPAHSPPPPAVANAGHPRPPVSPRSYQLSKKPLVHVGFSLPETSIDILGFYRTNGKTEIGCAHQCNTDLHLYGFGGDITYTNSVVACEVVPLYVGTSRWSTSRARWRWIPVA
jgi:hypothetical protein